MVKDCCPVCGYQFQEVQSLNRCPRCDNESYKDELITEDDDYAWCI